MGTYNSQIAASLEVAVFVKQVDRNDWMKYGRIVIRCRNHPGPAIFDDSNSAIAASELAATLLGGSIHLIRYCTHAGANSVSKVFSSKATLSAYSEVPVPPGGFT